MSRRLSMFTDLAKYRLPDPPRWRTHAWEDHEAFLYSTGYQRRTELWGPGWGCLPRGQRSPSWTRSAAMGRLPPAARRALCAQLATLDVADAAAIAGTNDTGRLRYNGRKELPAIDGARRRT